jgi:serine protease
MVPRSTRIGAAVSAVAIVGAYVIGSPGTGGADTVAAPAPVEQFEDLGVFTPSPPIDDGFNRFVLELPADVVAASGTDATGRAAAPTSTDGLELDRIVDEDGTAELIPDGEGNIWAHYPDGRKVLVSGVASGAEPAGTVSREQLIDALEADSQIDQVQPVDADTIAVVTTYTEVELLAVPSIAELEIELEVVVDEPVEAFEDPHFGSQWGLENTGQGSGYVADADIDILDAWTRSSAGAGVVVAVLDTGVDYGHPDLIASRWVNHDEDCTNGADDDGNGFVDDCYGWDFVQQNNTPWDGNNHFHGTHVAGIIAARRDAVGIAGVAPAATIMDLRVLDTRGSGYSSGFALAIRYAVDNGAHIINMSLGTQPGTSRSGFGSVEQAVQYAQSRGVLIVAAAGNSNVDIDTSNVWPASYAPLYDNVMTVASTDYADQRSSFSNYGVNSVTIGAPGSRILSTVPGGGWKNASGTSMAAPMAAGAAALLLGEVPGTPPPDAISRLVTVSDPQQSLSGLLVNPARINVGNLYEALGSPVRVQATGLSGLYEANGINALLNVRVNDAAMFAGRDFSWQARLLVAHEGVAYGVVEHAMLVNGSPVSTDTEALVPLSGAQSIVSQPTLGTTGLTFGMGTSLPAGTYALVIEAEATDGVSGLVAPPQAVFFNVAAGSPPTTTVAPTSVPPTTDGGGGSPAPVTTLPGTTYPGTTQPGTWPTTTAPTYDPDRGWTPTPQPPPPYEPYPTPTWPPTTWPVPTWPTPTTWPSPTEPQDPYGGTPTTWEWTSPSPAPTDPSPTSTAAPYQPTPTTTSPSPSPTSPAPTSPTTTSLAPTPPTTTQPGIDPEPATPSPAPGWSIFAVSPSAAEVRSNDLVALYGTFPLEPHVWFGESKATIISSSPNKLVVELPSVKHPAVVDITLRVETDHVLTVPWGFTFYQPGKPWPTIPVSTTIPTGDSPTDPGGSDPEASDPGGTPPEPDPAPATTTPTGTPPSPPDPAPSDPSPSDPGDSDPGTPDPGTPDPGGSDPGGTTPPAPTTTIPPDQSKWYTPGSAVTFGPAIALSNGLLGAPVTNVGPLGQIAVADWADQACASSSCVGTSLDGLSQLSAPAPSGRRSNTARGSGRPENPGRRPGR